MLPFPPRIKAPDYLAVNPLGTIPAFIDGDTRMTESAAICEYLASRYDAGGLSVLPGEPEYGRYLNMLHFGEATLTFPQTLLLRYGRFEGMSL
jgi:glutathione S-transferase